MGRTPKPWYWEARKAYYATVNGKRKKLGTSQKRAREELKRILNQSGQPTPASEYLVDVANSYLKWVDENRSASSFRMYRLWLQSFVNECQWIRIGNLTPRHIHDWVDKNPQWSDSTKRIAIVSVLRCLKWAKKHLGVENPIGEFPLPAPGRRVETLSLADFKTILRNTPSKEFRAFLLFCWDCGCRPQEARCMEARHVDLIKRRAVFPAEESKGKRSPRVIYFATDRSLRIVQRRLGGRHVFLNAKGTPWSKTAVAQRLLKLRDKTGIKVHAYMFRHTWITRKLLAGVDSHVVATLAGHKDTNMIDRVYSHVADNPDFLLDQAGREPRGFGTKG